MSNDNPAPLERDRPPEIDFVELVRRAQQGDETALGYLVSQCRDYLLAIANDDMDRTLQGKFGASDFVQETMLIAHKKFDQFRGQTTEELKGWLRQILRNDLNRARRQYIDARQRDVKRERAMEDSQNNAIPLVDIANTPRTDAIVQEEARLLNQAMSQLSENYRRAIQLREWQDKSFPEIGEAMGISEEAARKLFNRGMEKLQTLLKPYLRTDESDIRED